MGPPFNATFDDIVSLLLVISRPFEFHAVVTKVFDGFGPREVDTDVGQSSQALLENGAFFDYIREGCSLQNSILGTNWFGIEGVFNLIVLYLYF